MVSAIHHQPPAALKATPLTGPDLVASTIQNGNVAILYRDNLFQIFIKASLSDAAQSMSLKDFFRNKPICFLDCRNYPHLVYAEPTQWNAAIDEVIVQVPSRQLSLADIRQLLEGLSPIAKQIL